MTVTLEGDWVRVGSDRADYLITGITVSRHSISSHTLFLLNATMYR